MPKNKDYTIIWRTIRIPTYTVSHGKPYLKSKLHKDVRFSWAAKAKLYHTSIL